MSDFWVGPSAAPDTYRLVSLIGGGGEGEVWHGVLPLSTGGRRQVAVKVMRSPDGGGQVSWEQFGHLLTSLSHPGLVRVTDVFSGQAMHRAGTARGDATYRYVVMDHAPGATLRDWCDENPDATAAERLRMLRTVAAALDEMHSGAGTEIAVAHGDVKPANIVVTPEGATVLVDLGLVQLTDAAGPSGHSAPYAAPELRVVATSPVTARRPMLVRRIVDTLLSPPEARPRRLGVWLDSATETLSQVTTGAEHRGTAMTVTGPIGALTYGGAAPTGAPVEPASPDQGPPPRRRRRALALIVVGLVVVVLDFDRAAVYGWHLLDRRRAVRPVAPDPVRLCEQGRTYRTTQSTVLGFIPVGPKMIAGMAPYKRFLDEIGTELRQCDPAAQVSIAERA